MDELVFFYPDGHEAHRAGGHPERPERIQAAVEGLKTAGYWQRYPKIEAMELPKAILERVHTPAYLSVLETACTRYSFLDADTYTTPSSWDLALRAAGGASACALRVWQGQARSAFALCRPPGHHAGPGYGMGFCLINNIAVAAEALLQEGARRLAVIDLDLHHGNGTQDIFYSRQEVFYLSTHQALLFPGTGRIEEKGRDAGLGANANFPLPSGSGDEAFRAVMQRGILPLLERYEPEMLLVSMGFDTHWRDPLGMFMTSIAGMAEMIASLAVFARRRCGGKIAVVLEGGYDLEATAAGSAALAAGLLGEAPADPLGPSPTPDSDRWRDVLESQLRSFDL